MKVAVFYPLVTITGNFSTSRFKTTKKGVVITPRYQRNPTKHTLSVRPLKLACLAFKYADRIYQLFTPPTKARWRAAAKKPVKSPYDLWMQECLTNFNAKRNAPKTPSISGGYTTYKTHADSDIPPPTTEENLAYLDNLLALGKDPF